MGDSDSIALHNFHIKYYILYLLKILNIFLYYIYIIKYLYLLNIKYYIYSICLNKIVIFRGKYRRKYTIMIYIFCRLFGFKTGSFIH